MEPLEHLVFVGPALRRVDSLLGRKPLTRSWCLRFSVVLTVFFDVFWWWFSIGTRRFSVVLTVFFDVFWGGFLLVQHGFSGFYPTAIAF